MEYNNPVGQSGFNDKILEKMISFSRRMKEINPIFISEDFENMKKFISKKTFFYCDPPYLITLGSYNDGKRGFNGWNEDEEKRLYDFLNLVNKKGGKFMLSNVLEHKGKKNKILNDWLKENKYKVIPYIGKGTKQRKEIIVINY